MDHITQSQAKKGTQVVLVLPRAMPLQNVAGADVRFGFIVEDAANNVASVRYYVLDEYHKWAGTVTDVNLASIECLYPWQFTEQEKIDAIIEKLKEEEA